MKIVVKYGGNAMDAETDHGILGDVAALCQAGHQVVIVHGGGPEIDRALVARNVVTERVEGLRVTDAVTLEVTEAVLCGTLNKRLVRACLRIGLRAVGLSGEDGALLVARRASAAGRDLGFVGEIVRVDVAPLTALADAGFVPVVAPLALAEDASTAYNVNADTSAAAIAAALRADAFIVLTNVDRVRRDVEDPSTSIDALTLDEARTCIASGACDGGMRPKMRAAIDAIDGGARVSYICGTKFGAISGALNDNAATVIRRHHSANV